MAIIRDSDLIEDPNDIPVPLLVSCIKEHQSNLQRLNKLDEYYRGQHEILNRKHENETGLPNNKLIANHAKYITDIATGYFGGKPVKYIGNNIDEIIKVYKKIDIVSHDAELMKDLSIFGIGLELNFMTNSDPPIPKVTVIDPRQIFLVVDDSVEYHSLFAVHYYEKRDLDNNPDGWKIFVYTPALIVEYYGKDLSNFEMVDIREHFFGSVPVTEFWNNEEQQGDFEGVLTLIDAYNLLQSDRLNDKEQLVDAILKIKGMSLGDDDEEASRAIMLLKKLKVLEMPSSEADASWLTKQLNEGEVEILKDSLKSDIHEFSMVPNLTDENFASNVSGVAMRYKLFGMEQLAMNKERYFIQGLRERLKLFAHILAVQAKSVDVTETEIVMIRNLPEDNITIQEIVSLIDFVSNETLLSLLPFVSDAEEEIKKVKKQLEENIKRNKRAFDMPFDSEEVTEDEVA